MTWPKVIECACTQRRRQSRTTNLAECVAMRISASTHIHNPVNVRQVLISVFLRGGVFVGNVVSDKRALTKWDWKQYTTEM